ncbi:hypothetical protein E8K88_14575 [Lampropedia aestuarii]|uniref:Uncharacterized protein n=2 Tax=Lampropedia aestuarii TaxID=2562762 RepID=A0A4S5BGQ9_9BURK|nr:hypothetical protein E8K88_14575 [Lampropedia aestuarii]
MSGLAGAGGISGIDLQNLDIETAMMAIQSQRSQLLEGQLRGQLDLVSARNEQIASMHESISGKQSQITDLDSQIDALETGAVPASNERIAELTQMRDQLQQVLNRDPNGWTGLSWGWDKDAATSSHDMLARVKSEGLTNQGKDPKDIDGNGTMDAEGKTIKGWIEQLNSKIAEASEAEKTTKINSLQTEKATLNNEITDLKSGIDALNNTQQMDMLRLQSLTNKRNEAFDVMSNFIKKMQDSRSSIVGNMR